jgi:hypothetical protein
MQAFYDMPEMPCTNLPSRLDSGCLFVGKFSWRFRPESNIHRNTLCSLLGIELSVADTHQRVDQRQAETRVATAALISQAMKRPNGIGPFRFGYPVCSRGGRARRTIDAHRYRLSLPNLQHADTMCITYVEDTHRANEHCH